MKIEPKAYVARATFGQDRATVVAITYYLVPSKSHVGVEFREIMNTSDAALTFPAEGEPTFQQQLRTFREAAGFAPSREAEVLYIQQKMYEAYGAAAKVHIEPIGDNAP